jgi:hypothetical protein
MFVKPVLTAFHSAAKVTPKLVAIKTATAKRMHRMRMVPSIASVDVLNALARWTWHLVSFLKNGSRVACDRELVLRKSPEYSPKNLRADY